MYGQATLEIPRSGTIGPSTTDGLSDVLAITMGRIAAMTLSEHEGYVLVTLESGETKAIGHDTLTGLLTLATIPF